MTATQVCERFLVRELKMIEANIKALRRIRGLGFEKLEKVCEMMDSLSVLRIESFDLKASSDATIDDFLKISTRIIGLHRESSLVRLLPSPNLEYSEIESEEEEVEEAEE